MEFTKATYRRALRLAENEVASRSDILQWAKERSQRLDEDGWPLIEDFVIVQKARTDYFRALDFRTNLIRRARREGYVR